MSMTDDQAFAEDDAVVDELVRDIMLMIESRIQPGMGYRALFIVSSALMLSAARVLAKCVIQGGVPSHVLTNAPITMGEMIANELTKCRNQN